MTSALSDWIEDGDHRAVLDVFEHNQVAASDVSVTLPLSGDEVMFVVQAPTFPETQLTSELTTALKRKVRVTSDGAAWSAKSSRPLV